MYCVPVGAEGVGLPFCNPQITTIKSTRFVEIIQPNILPDLLFSGNNPQNADCDRYIGVFKINEEITTTRIKLKMQNV
jgi:hypothetical protein